MKSHTESEVEELLEQQRELSAYELMMKIENFQIPDELHLLCNDIMQTKLKIRK
jgi:hypothetical protein